MRFRVITAAALWLALCGCQTSPTAGSSGASRSGAGAAPHSAIVIKAASEQEGVAREYAWLDVHMPGAKVLSQSLVTTGGVFDVLNLRLPDGSTRDVYFDIASFFGKSAAVSEPASASSVPARPGHPASDPMFQFMGAWEGRLELFDAPRFASGAGHTINVRLVIDDNGAHVFTGKVGELHNPDFDWKEVKPGQFGIAQGASQAVVTATTSGEDEDGQWVESSTYTLVHDSPKTLVVYWVRTVNNLDVPADNPEHHFAWGGSGQFHQVETPDSLR